jgi:hypothetical protein
MATAGAMVEVAAMATAGAMVGVTVIDRLFPGGATSAFQNLCVISISSMGITFDLCACGLGPGLTFLRRKSVRWSHTNGL